ncbi:phosphate transport system substrate-binding protein [Alkalibacillus flavidus]|uniref:Phosphate-binding protein n=1 Tax=Alkalibacillus flavidus TaxID=546021 RepID=A0ABV2KT37_9BACI
MFNRVKFVALVTTILVFAGLLTACQSNDDNASAESNNGEQLDGRVVVDGSGTVYPLMSRLAENYMVNDQSNVSVEVGRSGTSAGFEKFLAEDGTDFNDASRKIKEEEINKAEELGINYKEIKLALDGLTIVAHPENDWATELTEEQVIDIFTAQGDIENWSDINSDWPNEPINLYGPNENHGTYEFFYESILNEQDLAEDADLQQEYSTLVQLVSQDKHSLGFFGFGYYDNNQDKLNAVSINFGDGPVAPSLDTIDESGPYQNFTRPVFTYLNTDHAQEKAQVLDFAQYVVDESSNIAGETGFAPLPEEEIDQLRQDLEQLGSE